MRRFDLVIRLEEGYRTDYANLGRLRIDLPDNRGQIELDKLADAHAVCENHGLGLCPLAQVADFGPQLGAA